MQGIKEGVAEMNEAAIFQEGSQNFAEIIQGADGAVSIYNEALTVQDGESLEAVIIQNTIDNTAVIIQTGSGNTCSVVQR